jgi:hypothetical protein
MRVPRPPARAIGACLAALVAAAPPAHAQAPGPAPQIDGIVALVGANPRDEGAATPLLASDVALRAALGTLLKGPAANGAAGVPDPAAARRRAILLALLARDARLGGDDGDPAARQAILDAVTANAGGEEGFAALLASWGAGAADAATWAGDVALATGQIAYLREQIEPPSDEEVQRRLAASDRRLDGLEPKVATAELREIIIGEQLAVALAALLAQALRDGTVRIVRR